MSARSTSDRINARLSQPLAGFVARMVGATGLYETPSEYIRDLIRRDMERREGQFAQDAILAGYRDLAAGRSFASSGDFKADMKTLAGKEEEGEKLKSTKRLARGNALKNGRENEALRSS